MSWFSRCSWCGGPFNGGNCRSDKYGDRSVPTPGQHFKCLAAHGNGNTVEFFEGWNPLSPLQLVVEEVMSE
ncbi:hypothetical protein Tco_1030322 [Tanacetum coccineum]|uniref:Uncharacterized protein n=1 Tax=Tanacetum coccineum TaxID=301880 RepID=A0ABQ5G6G4_9ASTR